MTKDIKLVFVAEERKVAQPHSLKCESRRHRVNQNWVNPLVNPDEPAPCDDPRKLWLLGQATSEGDVRFFLRVAVRFRDDGVAWVAVEDDAGGLDACHVYSVTDWRYNPETGWLHSGPIPVAGD